MSRSSALGFTKTMVVYASAVLSMFAGASAVHTILKPDMTVPTVPPTLPNKAKQEINEQPAETTDESRPSTQDS